MKEIGGGEAGVSGSEIIQGPVGQGKAFGVVEVDISKGGSVYGCELFFPKEEGSGSFSFLWQVADALVSARCCRRAHSYCPDCHGEGQRVCGAMW